MTENTKTVKKWRDRYFRKLDALTAAQARIRTLEAELHDLFAGKRVRGEWFALTAQDINELREEFGE